MHLGGEITGKRLGESRRSAPGKKQCGEHRATKNQRLAAHQRSPRAKAVAKDTSIVGNKTGTFDYGAAFYPIQ
jgi:hypothetical protein